MRRLRVGLAVSAILCLAGTAEANNINWTETWVMLGEGPNGPEWQISGFASGSEQYELFDIAPSVVANEVLGEQDVLLGWQIQLTIPNFVDPLPLKNLKVLFEGGNPGSSTLPTVLSIYAQDTPPGGGPTSEILCPTDCELLLTGSGFYGGDVFKSFELWRLRPNPDWEILTIFIPAEFEPIKFHVNTQSLAEVPEPAELLLMSLGLLGLGIAGRPRAA